MLESISSSSLSYDQFINLKSNDIATLCEKESIDTLYFPIDGTRTYFGLLGPVVRAISEGRVLCIDELDASLHPLLAMQLIRLFNLTCWR